MTSINSMNRTATSPSYTILQPFLILSQFCRDRAQHLQPPTNNVERACIWLVEEASIDAILLRLSFPGPRLG
ncbi:hypothetical protein BC937DRAFT_91430 [Endogone sp. FLAS-F59071]|nr:hypothetical protein BC937DRAFT_91430 [Endogone sp. FLAS-F59071]|eukprot:RUS16261.1 hypothetical protein BC937DRAFT_91430 [Endogone sp. FLAS-F59071]